MENLNKENEIKNYVKKIEIKEIFNKFNIIVDELKPGINILHGQNGSGKTTILHILKNILSGDYGRFITIDFRLIKITFDNDSFIEISKDKDNLFLRSSDLIRGREIFDNEKDKDIEDIERKIYAANERSLRFGHLLEASYFPAFRSMIEAWDLARDDRSVFTLSEDIKTDEDEIINLLARKIFGTFVPTLNYLSPLEIEKYLFNIFQSGRQEVLYHNQKILTRSFRNIFSYIDCHETNSIDFISQNVFEEIKKLAREIKKHPLQENINFIEGLEEKVDSIFSNTQNNTDSSINFAINVLNAYRDSLKEIVDFQNKVYEPISRYINSVNSFLNRKKIDINTESITEADFLSLIDSNSKKFGGIKHLSSGERQIFTLMYAVTNISSEKIILIDEPEISIHIDTQVRLLNNISELVVDKQIIVCTHSPTIAGKQLDRLKKIELVEIKLNELDCDQENKLEETEMDDTEKNNKENQHGSYMIDDFGIYGKPEAINNDE